LSQQLHVNVDDPNDYENRYVQANGSKGFHESVHGSIIDSFNITNYLK
jgi:hypothetical protein